MGPAVSAPVSAGWSCVCHGLPISPRPLGAPAEVFARTVPLTPYRTSVSGSPSRGGARPVLERGSEAEERRSEEPGLQGPHPRGAERLQNYSPTLSGMVDSESRSQRMVHDAPHGQGWSAPSPWSSTHSHAQKRHHDPAVSAADECGVRQLPRPATPETAPKRYPVPWTGGFDRTGNASYQGRAGRNA